MNTSQKYKCRPIDFRFNVGCLKTPLRYSTVRELFGYYSNLGYACAGHASLRINFSQSNAVEIRSLQVMQVDTVFDTPGLLFEHGGTLGANAQMISNFFNKYLETYCNG